MSSFEPFLYGKYIILNRIAIGGMAEVFFAKSYGVRGFQRLLVIKRILPHLSKDEEFVEMFIDEAKISVELNHANICQVTDLGKIDGNYFIAMEYVNGKDLRAILKKAYVLQKQIPIEFSIYLIAEALKGLDYAHKREDTITGRSFSVIHRDISPQNIMLSYQGDVKIVDFGIAKTEFKLHRTQAGVLKGKFAYMSPEQAMGLELDPRTDVFSASIILYELLSGERLFLGETDFETLERIKECKVPSLQNKQKNFPPELDQILQQALSKNADDRFQSAGDMQIALTKLLYSKFPDFHPEQVSDFVQNLFKEEIKAENQSLKHALSKISDEQIQKAEKASELDQENHGHQTILSPSSLKLQGIRGFNLTQIFRFDQWSTLGKTAAMFVLAFLVYFVAKAVLVKKPEAPPTEQKRAKSTQLKEATFIFSSIPDQAWVYLNGEKKGLTPLNIILPTDTFYDLEIQKEGFISYRREFQTDPQALEMTAQLEKVKPILGTISITTSPTGAKIYVDNEDTGLNSPATLQNLQINQSYKIVVEKDGYRNITRNILVEKPSEEISINLEKITATLKIHTVPSDVQIQLDGKNKEHTIEGLGLNQKYTLNVSKEGYEPVTKSVTINNSYVELDIELKKKETKFGFLSVSATPWAQVIIDGNVVGPSPVLSHQLHIGSHEVILRHPDFDDIKKTITIKENQNEKLIIDLRNP
ncbi:MAG: serine/threonine protein kinase [Bdellovibrionales bacterium]|nr:serine/threonine protein kinase [Bdellovibrionales bacterium]